MATPETWRDHAETAMRREVRVGRIEQLTTTPAPHLLVGKPLLRITRPGFPDRIIEDPGEGTVIPILPDEDVQVVHPRPTRMTAGFYVVMSEPPGPTSDFVELEDERGRSVGPEESGASWHHEPNGMWVLGPFRRAG